MVGTRLRKIMKFLSFCLSHAARFLERDKLPDHRPRDFYHTCYNLSGLSLAQHFVAADSNCGGSCLRSSPPLVFGDAANLLVKHTLWLAVFILN